MNKTAAIILIIILALTAAYAEERPKVAHVTVALCDNMHQGIAPVPTILGNGQDPKNNLYWGAMYGVKTFFKSHCDWRLVTPMTKHKITTSPCKHILERIILYNNRLNTYIVADAWDGKHIKAAITTFLYPTEDRINLTDKVTMSAGIDADLRAYCGHDGLMEFSIARQRQKNINETPAIILSCMSKKYFSPYMKSSGLSPLLWTTDLMSPEAYTLEAAISSWATKNSSETIREAAAKAYARYQNCGIKYAQNLLTYDIRNPEVKPQPNKQINKICDIKPPRGFTHTINTSNSFATFIEQLPLKPQGSSVLDWQNKPVIPPDKIFAIINHKLLGRLEQCADVAIRLRATYLRQRQNYKKINFRSLSGQEISYKKWLKGKYRLSDDGKKIEYSITSNKADLPDNFRNYLNFVMAYANSNSLARDLSKQNETTLAPGDIYVQPGRHGALGHVSIILSVCQNKTGKRLHLLGYGFTPAQNIRIPHSHSKDNPWLTIPELKAHLAKFGKGYFHRFDK